MTVKSFNRSVCDIYSVMNVNEPSDYRFLFLGNRNLFSEVHQVICYALMKVEPFYRLGLSFKHLNQILTFFCGNGISTMVFGRLQKAPQYP